MSHKYGLKNSETVLWRFNTWGGGGHVLDVNRFFNSIYVHVDQEQNLPSGRRKIHPLIVLILGKQRTFFSNFIHFLSFLQIKKLYGARKGCEMF